MLYKPRGNEIASRAHEMGFFGTSFRERGWGGPLQIVEWRRRGRDGGAGHSLDIGTWVT